MAKRIKNENSRMLQSLESRFNILQRNETKILSRIEGQRQRAQLLMDIKDLRDKEKRELNRKAQINHNHLQQQRLSNFKAKEGQRLSLSIVQQSMMLNKKLNHLEIRRRRNSNEKLLLSQRSSELSAKRERSESLKKQRLQQI